MAEHEADEYRYLPPAITPVGEVRTVTEGSYSKDHSDDSDAGSYWANPDPAPLAPPIQAQPTSLSGGSALAG